MEGGEGWREGGRVGGRYLGESRERDMTSQQIHPYQRERQKCTLHTHRCILYTTSITWCRFLRHKVSVPSLSEGLC